MIESREAWRHAPHVQKTQANLQTNILSKKTLFLSRSHTNVQYPTLTYLLGLLDTGHVLFGQAGAVQGLLWILSVALEHLGLQLSAHGRSLPRSTQKQRVDRRVTVVVSQHCRLRVSLVTVHAQIS